MWVELETIGFHFKGFKICDEIYKMDDFEY